MSSSGSMRSTSGNVTPDIKGDGRRSSPSEGTPLLPTQSTEPLSDNNMTDIFCACRRFADRKFIVDTLAILFGISAWTSVNGMFVQLPLMVQTQPEGWNLPSYLSVIVQIANVGPILYSISQKFCHGKIKDSSIIYVLLIFGSIALLLMAFFYHRTIFISGGEYSAALFILSFFGSLVGCTSSVLFMPFMGNFREIYLISYFVGEGLSGFLPSIVALIQGVGGNPVCKPSVTNSSILEPYTEPPRFSTKAFYFFLFVMLSLSTMAFYLLNNLRICQSERSDSRMRSRAPSKKYAENNSASKDITGIAPAHNPIFTVREDIEVLMKDAEHKPCPALQTTGENNKPFRTSSIKDCEESATSPASQPVNSLSGPFYFYFLFLASWVCMFGNGIFPSIQSYSCLPYGNIAYHLSVTLGSMANPMACFLAFFYPYTSVPVISFLASVSTIVTGYIVTTALLSPAPPLVNTATGEALVVLSWVLVQGLITYVKVSIASLFRREGGRSLFWCGAVQQMGSAVGALLSFFLINYTKMFTSYYPCS